MPLLLMETPASPRLNTLAAAIRRDILSVLAESDTATVPSATAQVAAGWSARRRRRGGSPSAERAAAAIVCLVGADLVDEVAERRCFDRRAFRCSRRPAIRCVLRSTARPGSLVSSGRGREEGSELLGMRRGLVRITRKAA